jgi:hypothetical protein
MRATCPAYDVLLALNTLITYGDVNTSRTSVLSNFLQPAVFILLNQDKKFLLGIPWKWRQYGPSKHWKGITKWRSVVFQEYEIRHLAAVQPKASPNSTALWVILSCRSYWTAEERGLPHWRKDMDSDSEVRLFQGWILPTKSSKTWQAVVW